MNLQERKELLLKLGSYLKQGGEEWKEVSMRAYGANNWFTQEFVNLSARNIADQYLTEAALDRIIQKYGIGEPSNPKKVGIVMAGNIPMVGFHDLMSVFLSGHIAMVKPSSKDDALMRHLIEKCGEWSVESGEHIKIAELLKGCDAYIATGSNNSSRYFDYYFRNYPTIIRKNRTSVAILDGTETAEELNLLADDIHLYFGLGCRNVTKLYVPKGYDFIPLLDAFKKYGYLLDHNKFKNNYDYNLAVYILNNRFYMTSGSVLLVEDEALFSPIAQVNYEFYNSISEVRFRLLENESVQCVVGKDALPFGQAQCPAVEDFADGVDTMKFLTGL